MKILAISLAYPPLAYPRSIQVARLLKYSDIETALFCGDEPYVRSDPTIEVDSDSYLKYCQRVRVKQTSISRWTDMLSYRFYRSYWNSCNLTPDPYLKWKDDVIDAVDKYLGNSDFKPDAIVTFAQPFTDHLIGIELKQRYGLPWLAHFSDPWVDNPFNPYDIQTRSRNQDLERQVVETADLLAFTSDETIDLVFSKYAKEYRKKARLLPQCYDEKRFSQKDIETGREIVVRYLGHFYGNRTAGPLVEAVSKVNAADPGSLEGVCFELVGPGDPEQVKELAGGLPDGLIRTRPAVNYQDSLRLMSEADGLLVIDAPADFSVFLPSKLIDYIGAGKPVFGITPPGTAWSLILELGGMVTDSVALSEAVECMQFFIRQLRQRRTEKTEGPWGDPTVRARFSAEKIASDFRELVSELLEKQAVDKRSK